MQNNNYVILGSIISPFFKSLYIIFIFDLNISKKDLKKISKTNFTYHKVFEFPLMLVYVQKNR